MTPLAGDGSAGGDYARSEPAVARHARWRAVTAALQAGSADYDVLVVGTIAASLDPAQARLVETLAATGRPLVTAALRTPYDLAAYPSAAVNVATYGLLPPSLEALAAALFGRIRFGGRLPVAVPGVAAAATVRAPR